MSLLFCLDIVKPLSLRSGCSYLTCLYLSSSLCKHGFVVFLFYCIKKKKKKKKIGGEDA
jgi:hypothetical protein